MSFPRYHTVVKGDTLMSLAARYYKGFGGAAKWVLIFNAPQNNIYFGPGNGPQSIRPGYRLVIPSPHNAATRSAVSDIVVGSSASDDGQLHGFGNARVVHTASKKERATAAQRADIQNMLPLLLDTHQKAHLILDRVKLNPDQLKLVMQNLINATEALAQAYAVLGQDSLANQYYAELAQLRATRQNDSHPHSS